MSNSSESSDDDKRDEFPARGYPVERSVIIVDPVKRKQMSGKQQCHINNCDGSEISENRFEEKFKNWYKSSVIIKSPKKVQRSFDQNDSPAFCPYIRKM